MFSDVSLLFVMLPVMAVRTWFMLAMLPFVRELFWERRMAPPIDP